MHMYGSFLTFTITENGMPLVPHTFRDTFVEENTNSFVVRYSCISNL